MSKAMITGTCDICKEPITPARDEVQFRRNLGQHKLHQHGIKGITASPESKRIAARERYWRTSGKSEAEIVELRKKYESDPQRTEPTPWQKKKQAEEAKKAKPLKLKSCPNCGAEYYKKVNGKMESIGLSECSDCSIRFYFTNIINQ